MKAYGAGFAIGAFLTIVLLKGWAFMLALQILGVSLGYFDSIVAALLLTFAVGLTVSNKD